jgi:cytochrome c-type biogenesis protein CcmH
MTLWISFSVMSLAAIAFAAWPLYRQQGRLTAISATVIVAIVALSSGLYHYQGSPGTPSNAGGEHALDDVIESLAARLEANPDDLNGWKMLGRSYMSTGNYAAAAEAFDKAMQLEAGQDATTLVALGEALLAGSGESISGRIAALFENALAIDPNNPQALFYGGIGAFNRGDQAVAADRWERLLSLNPPAEIEGILRQRIAEWRGEPVPEAPPAAAAEPVEVPGAVVIAQVSLSAAAIAALPADGTVFIIARDPAQPVPPIAVSRRRLSELPATVQLGDRESMVPGRSLSGFAKFELIARVSLSGQPGAQPGDWFGSVLVTPAQNNHVAISISEQVP